MTTQNGGPYQIFTRHVGRGSNPRRSHEVDTAQEAIDYCTERNAKRSAKQRRDRFFYEWTTSKYYREAWG